MHILLAYVHFLLYLCTAFSFREASEILAQTRCCDSQSDVHYLFRSLANCQLSKLGRPNKGAISQKTCYMHSLNALVV